MRAQRLAQRALALPYSGPEQVAGLPGALLFRANRGRTIFDGSGQLSFPPEVRRVWIDVGAHELESPLAALLSRPDLGVIAIEPLWEKWATWPNVPNLITIPFAIYSKEGSMTFHVNAYQATSSLLPSAADSRFDVATRTVEERPVTVIRLDRIMSRIPTGTCIEFLKTDVQGVDLQVLQSAGAEIKRVKVIRTEVSIRPMYEKQGESMSTREEFETYLAELGFHELGVSGDRPVDGKIAFVNLDFGREDWECAVPRAAESIRQEVNESIGGHERALAAARPLAESSTATSAKSSTAAR